MEQTLGKRMSMYRKAKSMTQEEIATHLGVSAQAVSKWENDGACPDILLLVPIARLFNVSVDVLLDGEKVADVQYVKEAERKKFEELTLRILIHAGNGDRVRVNLPMPLIKVALEIGMKLPQVSGNEQLEAIDLAQILLLVENGLIGNLVEIESADGDTVLIVVE